MASGNPRVSTGQLSERAVLRRSSVRETIARALRSTLPSLRQKSSEGNEKVSRNSSEDSGCVQSTSSSGSSLKSCVGGSPRNGLPPSPSVITLKHFDVDLDDTRSCASTGTRVRRLKDRHATAFLNSPVRLRRRDSSSVRPGEDDVDCGFVKNGAQPLRCQSTQSLAYSGGSQFHTLNMRSPYEANYMPTAVVGPHRVNGSQTMLSQSFYDERQQAIENHRRSLHALNALSVHSLHNSYSEFPVGDMPPPGRASFLPANGRTVVGTPHAIRRTMNVNVVTSPYSVTSPHHLESPMFTSTPNKATVAPQPHRRHRERNVDGDASQSGRHASMGMVERRGSGPVPLPGYQSYMRSDEVYVDEAPKDSRVAALEARVRDLEAKLSSAEASTSLVIPVTPTTQSKNSHRMPGNAHLVISPSPRLMVKNAEREEEIDELKTKLKKAFKTSELQQAQYNEDLHKLGEESKAAREELMKMKSRTLESECELYKNKAAAIESQQKNDIGDSRERMRQQEKELAALKAELEKKRLAEEELESLRKELEYMELQNEALNTTLDVKEDSIKQLEGESMRLEASLYQQSCSSGSTPLAEEQQSLADVRPPPYRGGDRAYTKAHSTLGMELSLPSPTHLTKSFSNYQIDGGTRNISPIMSQLLRSQQKKVVDCRLLSKCLKESAERAFTGQSPNLNSLLALKTDSLSESEAEAVAFDSSSMSMHAAEKQLRRQEDELVKIERDLSAIRGLLQHFYQQRLEKEVDDDDGCRLQ